MIMYKLEFGEELCFLLFFCVFFLFFFFLIYKKRLFKDLDLTCIKECVILLWSLKTEIKPEGHPWPSPPPNTHTRHTQTPAQSQNQRETLWTPLCQSLTKKWKRKATCPGTSSKFSSIFLLLFFFFKDSVNYCLQITASVANASAVLSIQQIHTLPLSYFLSLLHGFGSLGQPSPFTYLSGHWLAERMR